MRSLEYSGWMSFPRVRNTKFYFSLSPPHLPPHPFPIVFYLFTCFHINSPFCCNLCCKFYIKLHWWMQNENKLVGFCPCPTLSARSTNVLPLSRISQLLQIHHLSHLWNYVWWLGLPHFLSQLLQDTPNDKGQEVGVRKHPTKDSFRKEGTVGWHAHIQVMSESRTYR